MGRRPLSRPAAGVPPPGSRYGSLLCLPPPLSSPPPSFVPCRREMDPDLLRSLAAPGSKPEREALLALGQLLAEQSGPFLLLGPPPGPDPQVVLVSRESPESKPPPPRLLPGEKKASALEQVLNGLNLSSEPDRALSPDSALRQYLSCLGQAEGSPRVEPEPPAPISGRGDGAGGAGDPDCLGDGLDLRLVPVRDAWERDTDLQGGEQVASAFPSSPEPAGPAGTLDSHLSAEESGPAAPVMEGPVDLPAESDLSFAMESPPEAAPFHGLLFGTPWTPYEESYKDQSPPGSPLLRPLDPQVAQGGVDLFPAFCSTSDLSPHLEFGEAEPHLGEEPPASVEDSSRLRAVFDALDGDGDGFVRIEEFIQFATVYGAEQVEDLTKFLDPAGLGVISFEDFYRGISAIRNGADPDGQLCAMGYMPEEEEESPSACQDDFDDFVAFEANEVTDSAYMGSESTYSECETFTDEDTSTLVHHEMHDEVETDSAIDSTVHSEYADPIEEPESGSHPRDLPLSADINGHAIVTVISGEEQFEDYGEGNEADLFSESLCNGENSYTSSSFLSPSAVPLTTQLHSILTDEAFEFYCSQCHKQINRLEDLSARLSDLEMNSPHKRISSKKVARHLHQTGALTVDGMEETFQNSTDCLEEDIADKVIFLEKRVTELEKDTAANGEQHSRLKQENLQLVHRANALEEQLKEQELRADEILVEEIRRQRELLTRMEREKSIEIENLQARLQQLDEENGELRSCVPCLRANIERLEEEKRKLVDEIEDLTVQLNEELESKRKLGDKLSHERHQFQKDKESTQELIEDLRKQLEHLQLFKLEAEQRRGRSSSIGLQEYNSRTREMELEQEIRRLKQDNRNLKEQNDELNGQIINLSIQGAKNLFSASFSESLAAEISSVSRDELLEATQKQKEINLRLQDYIDRIIVAIMETNPSILEVK
ncbi:rab11 family-interacting protein 3 isoform X1 [Paroedura picta]|uniref:rab11 family-interacting protein 3 isoform X1 n=2 Tax=Paroedura picta TaxID=143630 RepID=UPI0040578CED